MNILIRFTFLVFVNRINTVYSQNAAPSDKGPGASSCIYFGGVDEMCNYAPVTVNDLPAGCTSFYFDGLKINSSHDVSMKYPDTEQYFDMLGQDGNNLFMNIEHLNYAEWVSVLDSEGCNAKIEAKNIHDFTSNHPGLKGLVLARLQADEKLGQAITKSHIPTDKVYFKIPLNPYPPGESDVCSVTYEVKCTEPNKANDWCADTQETFFKKGQWFKQNGAGFIGFYLDFDDPQNTCNCGQFPGFNAIRAGFNGTASLPPCPLYDGQC